MNRDTIFRVASMVKLITTVAALRLVEQGKLSLEAPVPDIDPVVAAPQVLDGFDPAGKPLLRPAKRPISLHDLLTHTAGFVYRLWDSEALKYYKAIDKLPAIERSKLPHTPLMFDPGERWQYGGNIDWVGRIVQAVSGEPLDAHFRKHIFEPLGMNDTGFVISPMQWAREASGHRRQPDGSLKAEAMGRPPKWPPAPQSFSGGGGICSSAPDYLTLIRMLMNGGALNGVRILRPDTVALMGQNQIGRIDVGVLRTTVPAVSNDVDFFPRHQAEMGLWPHDHHRAGGRRPQRRQSHLGWHLQHVLLDRPEEADCRGVHDPGAALRRRARVARLPTVRTRHLCGDKSWLRQSRLTYASTAACTTYQQNGKTLAIRQANECVPPGASKSLRPSGSAVR